MAESRTPRAGAEQPSGDAAATAEAGETEAGNGAVELVRIAAVLAAVESVAAFVFAIVELASFDAERPSVAITTGVFLLLYAVGLAFAARGMWNLKRWSRSPIVLAQLIQLGLAWSFAGGETVWVTVVLAVPAVAVLVLAFLPSSTLVLYGRRGDDHLLNP